MGEDNNGAGLPADPIPPGRSQPGSKQPVQRGTSRAKCRPHRKGVSTSRPSRPPTPPVDSAWTMTATGPTRGSRQPSSRGTRDEQHCLGVASWSPRGPATGAPRVVAVNPARDAAHRARSGCGRRRCRAAGAAPSPFSATRPAEINTGPPEHGNRATSRPAPGRRPSPGRRVGCRSQRGIRHPEGGRDRVAGSVVQWMVPSASRSTGKSDGGRRGGGDLEGQQQR